MMKLILSLILIACLSIVPSSAREWTDNQGRKVTADFLELKNSSDGETVVLKMSNGRTYEIPLATLSEADQDYARKAQTDESAPSAVQASVFGDAIKPHLVTSSGRRTSKHELATSPEYYAIYFSAAWCGPCRRFTPDLVDFYNTHRGEGEKFEIIFVSSDRSERDMAEYMKDSKMPWPALDFGKQERIKMVESLKGRGIPCLVLVDRDGNVVSHSYVDGNYVGPRKVMGDLLNLIQG